MILGADNIARLFSIFHDGKMLNARCGGKDAVIEVEIRYLAQRIGPGRTRFIVRFFDAENFSFDTWENEPAGASKMLIGLDSIFQHELEILSSESVGDGIVVACNAPGANQNFCGGELRFQAKRAQVTDEMGVSWSLEQFAQLSHDYWSEWSQKNRGCDV